MRILQLTDIHIGGDYDGKFKCKLNFVVTLMEAMRKSEKVDLVVITGDLADNNYDENYKWIRNVLSSNGCPYIVLPGNHDDVDAMKKVFYDNAVTDYAVKDGILFWNNRIDNHDIPFDTIKAEIAFCHYPVGYVKHAFMEKHAHPKANEYLEKLESCGVKRVFCGHFHYPDIVYDGTCAVRVAPATQCQLDPNDTECVPMDFFPGYEYIVYNENCVGSDSHWYTVDPMGWIKDIYELLEHHSCSDDIRRMNELADMLVRLTFKEGLENSLPVPSDVAMSFSFAVKTIGHFYDMLKNMEKMHFNS